MIAPSGNGLPARYQPVAEGEVAVRGFALDATDIYWSVDGGRIHRHPLASATSCSIGSTCAEVTAAAGGAVGVTALDATHVHFALANGSIRKIAKAGGEITTLATNQPGPVAIATDGIHVYWANTGIGTASKSLRRTKVDGAVCDGDACESIAKVNNPTAIILDDKAVYWTDAASDGGVYKRAK